MKGGDGGEQATARLENPSLRARGFRFQSGRVRLVVFGLHQGFRRTWLVSDPSRRRCILASRGICSSVGFVHCSLK